MQTRRTGLAQLAVPPNLHRRSSLLSLNSAASPHTPRSSGCFDACPPPVCYAANRKSTDSWNSSNADDMDFDWKPDQILLLTRTLDALPAHLVTPFNGPIPPSNLLDKIARGVANAKGPLDWPHSIRATRTKLLELARARAKEDVLAEKRRHIIQEEDAVEIEDGSASNYSYTHDAADKPLRSVGIGPRRPLYRQSSMDFIKPGAADLKNNPNIARLSNRLQRTDRTFPNPGFHPYARAPRTHTKVGDENRRSASPPHSSDVPSLLSPSTPSSTTLNSDASLPSAALLGIGLRPRASLRRSASTLSSSSLFSTSSGGMAQDPRLQRVRRSDSFAGGVPPPPPPKDHTGVKRAPSYGALAQDARAKAAAQGIVKTPTKDAVQEKTPQKDRHVRQLSAGAYPSSDEEEKARTKRAKKMRVRGASGGDPELGTPVSPASSVPPSPSVGIASAAASPVASPRVMRVRLDADGGMSPRARVVKPYLYNQLMMLDAKNKLEEKEKVVGTEKEAKEKGRSKTYRASTSKDNKSAMRDTDNNKTATAPSSPASPAPVQATTTRAPRMSAQRNPSMFGAELPRAAAAAAASVPVLAPAPPARRVPLLARAPLLVHNLAAHTLALAAAPAPGSPASENASPSPRVKTLRRVRRLPGARRIEFGGAEEEARGGAGGLEEGFQGKRGLGSAFQMS